MIYICSADRQQVSKRRSSSEATWGSETIVFACLLSPLLRNGSAELPLPREMLERWHTKKSALSLFPGQNCSRQCPLYLLANELKHANRRKACRVPPALRKHPKSQCNASRSLLKTATALAEPGGREVVHAVKAINASLSLKKGNCAANADRFDRKCLH